MSPFSPTTPRCAFPPSSRAAGGLKFYCPGSAGNPYNTVMITSPLPCLQPGHTKGVLSQGGHPKALTQFSSPEHPPNPRTSPNTTIRIPHIIQTFLGLVLTAAPRMEEMSIIPLSPEIWWPLGTAMPLSSASRPFLGPITPLTPKTARWARRHHNSHFAEF